MRRLDIIYKYQSWSLWKRVSGVGVLLRSVSSGFAVFFSPYEPMLADGYGKLVSERVGWYRFATALLGKGKGGGG